MIRRQLLPAVAMIAIFTVLTGLVYPLAMTVVAQGVFGDEADGSLIERDGDPVGSALIGQPFALPSTSIPAPPPPARATTPAPAPAPTRARPTRTCSPRSPSGPPPTEMRTTWPTMPTLRSTP